MIEYWLIRRGPADAREWWDGEYWTPERLDRIAARRTG